MEKPNVFEEITYVWECPECGLMNEEPEDPRDYGVYDCEQCEYLLNGE